MKIIKKIIFTSLALAFCSHSQLTAHCQMPCGIYHDDMVFDQVDQYIETMAKGVSVLTANKGVTIQERNEFTRWVIEKDEASDEIANVLVTFFLQQKIKPNEDDTVKRITSVHKLLFYIVTIKQTVDMKYLNDFYEEWENFKLMFHIEGYACKLEQIKLKKWAEKKKGEQIEKEGEISPSHDHSHGEDFNHDHDHDHDHAHDHTH